MCRRLQCTGMLPPSLFFGTIILYPGESWVVHNWFESFVKEHSKVFFKLNVAQCQKVCTFITVPFSTVKMFKIAVVLYLLGFSHI